jgi:cellulose synthase (UDP-forming)
MTQKQGGSVYQMKAWIITLAICVLLVPVGFPVAGKAATNTVGQATSVIRKESNGFWLYVDGKKTPVFGGAVYQNTEGDLHVLSYSNSLHSLYTPLDEEAVGGSGHGARLERMGFSAIRVYELPVENADDANHVKEIFRRLYANYHIKVLIGDWAGLQNQINFQDPRDLKQLQSHLARLVATYGNEPWVLGWQLGNENNYHIQNGKLGHQINLDAAGYYRFMDGLAGLMKAELGKRRLSQFVSLGQGDLTEEEAGLIASMKNIDAVGINCYRDDMGGFDNLVVLAADRIPRPIYFAEAGKPASDAGSQEDQKQYLYNICRTAFSHGAGHVDYGNVLAVFIHEATDEAWKKFDRGEESDAHYGFFGKQAEEALSSILHQNQAFSTWVLPANESPDALTRAAWGCLESPYTHAYGREYGYAMAYASRAVTLYQDTARSQEAQLASFKSPPEVAANGKFWALNTVGSSYFIIGNAWMMMSYDLKGSEHPKDAFDKTLQLAGVGEHTYISPGLTNGVLATNAANCIFYAKQVFATLHNQYPYAQLQDANGNYWSLEHAVQSRFPELTPPYIPMTWRNGAIFVGAGLFMVLGLASISRWRASKKSVASVSVLSAPARFLFLLALVLNLASLFWFVSWWFDPVRLKYYTVQPVLYWALTTIGATGVLMYFFFWFLLWNMRRPVPIPAPEGLKVAIVTTRVASEAVEAIEGTLEKMSGVDYPHDSYLLDEEDNEEARALCEKWGVRHFSRKGNVMYNQSSGKFQAKTKGGNLNSWLYEFGKQYEFVTFLDPDHAPHADFLDQVLGYFSNPNVAFVQAPQVFYNRGDNWVARGAAEQSYFFYGPMQMGLFTIGSCVVNGSHSTFRVSDLFALKDEAYAVHDADDVLTSMRIHALGKSGVYVPEVLAEGLAPDTWAEFAKQQRRWAYSMFQLFFHYYLSEFRHMPWRCRLVYMVMSTFYFRGVLFCGLLLMPFVSAVMGNPPVNAHVTAFCLRYIPFFLFHCTLLMILGQKFLIRGGSKTGFWYRAGILWVAMWWDMLCAMFKGLRSRRVAARVVAAKWKPVSTSPWMAVRAHIFLATAALGAFLWTCLRTDRRETIWGTLLFLGLIVLSQSIIIFMVTRPARKTVPVAEPVRETVPLAMSAAYSQPHSKL